MITVIYCLFMCFASYGDRASFGVNLALFLGAVIVRFSIGMFFAQAMSGRSFSDESIIDFLSGEETPADEITLTANPKIFNKSVRENIMYGNFHATDEEYRKVCDTVLIRDDEYLLESDKQKIALARVLLFAPKEIIIANGLDACDNITKKRIINNIKRNYPDIILGE